eukprot:10664669-Heterocapsa_arctica.AAC.1
MSTMDVRRLAKRYRDSNDGLDALDDEEASADQIAGVRAKLDADVVPFADFGILRPFGNRLGRTL